MARRWLLLLPAILILIFSVGLRIVDPTPVADLRLSVFDSYLRATPRQADTSDPVKVVAIDEASLKQLGQWPWPRTVLAELISRLTEAGARTIAIDVILPEADRLSASAFISRLPHTPEFAAVKAELRKLPENDDTLAEAIKNGPVVLGVSGATENNTISITPKASVAAAGDPPHQFLPDYPSAIASLKKLTEKATGLGAVNWIPEHDLIIRRVPLLFTIAGKVLPSLSLETLRMHHGESTILVKSSGSSGLSAFGQNTGVELVKVGSSILPTNSKGEVWLRLSEERDTRTISAVDVLKPDFDKTRVKGRHIFIGASAVGLYDLRATPLSQSVPGVEVHAQALEQMLANDHAVRPAYATGYELLFLIGVGALTIFLIGRVGPMLAAVTGVAAILALLSASWLAYKNAGLLFDPIYPSLSVIALYLAGSLVSYISSEKERIQVRSAFSSYVAPALVEELAKNPDKLKLGGETRTVTCLFADIRGFTSLSEGRTAEELIEFINQLFDPLTQVILDHNGTIDKYMGDAVMAFWNAPLDDTDHAKNACKSALRIQDKLSTLNERWQEAAKKAGEPEPNPVNIGIGLNTGPCCVGNMGSSQRFDYSVIGDTVNIASRLENETKSYGCTIIVGEDTTQAAPELAYLRLGKITLRGKSTPQNIYALVGGEDVAQSEQFKLLKDRHTAAINAIEKNQREDAEKILAGLREEACPTYYTSLLEHLTATTRRT